MRQYAGVCVAIAIYVILIILYLSFDERLVNPKERDEKFINCSKNDPCVTFCEHSDYTKLSDDVIKKKFPNHDSTSQFEIVKKNLWCAKSYEKKKIYENEKDWGVINDGDVMLFSDEYFSPWGIYLFTNDQYCLQPYLDDGSNLKLKLEVCVDDVLFLKQIHYFFLALTAIFLITPLFVYVSIKEIRQTLHGKLCIALFATQIYIIFIMPITDYYSNHYFKHFLIFFYLFGSFSTNFVVNLMCFDIYLSFKHFRQPHYQSRYFKNFTCFLIIFCVLAAIVTYFVTSIKSPRTNDVFSAIGGGVVVTFVFTLLMNIFALIMSFYYLIALTRSTTIHDNTRLDMEKERFWLYMKLFAIMSIVWFVELNTSFLGYSLANPNDLRIVCDVITCYSGLLPAILLLWTPRVYSLVFEKYNSFKDDHESNAKNEDDV